MRHYLSMVPFLTACNFAAVPPQTDREGTDSGSQVANPDVISRRLSFFADVPADVGGCQQYVEQLAERLETTYEVVVDAALVESDYGDLCHLAYDYHGNQTLQLHTMGGGYSDMPWRFPRLEDCRADQARQKQLFEASMQGIVVHDRCSNVDAPVHVNVLVYTIEAIVPEPLPAVVRSFFYDPASPRARAYVDGVVSEMGAKDFTPPSRNDATRVFYVPATMDATTPYIWQLAQAEWYDYLNKNECEATIDRIDVGLKARFEGLIVDRECRGTSSDGFSPMFTASTQVRPGGLQRGLGEATPYSTFEACSGAADALDERLIDRVHFCEQAGVEHSYFVVFLAKEPS